MAPTTAEPRVAKPKERKRERFSNENSKALRWKKEDLAKGRKIDPQKVRLPLKVRQETTLTIDQIAQHLHMGTRQTLNTELKRWKQTNP